MKNAFNNCRGGAVSRLGKINSTRGMRRFAKASLRVRFYSAFALVAALGLTAPVVQAQESKTSAPGYENDFEKAELDKTPGEFLVLDGAFTVKEESGNKFLELPGAPLETFGLLFGPTLESDMVVSAKMRGTSKGRRHPTFALGLNGVGGYRLQVSPAKKLVELYKGDEVVATAPFEDKLDSWFLLRLENRKAGENEWKVEGKVWPEKSAEPNEPTIVLDEKAKPVPGRASIWGSPYSGTPIQFDKLSVKMIPTE